MENIPGKIFENKNDGMLMEFATGLRDYCKSMVDCDDWTTDNCMIKDMPENWRV